MLLNCSTCFERYIAHHQELKNCNCSLWFYIRLWLPPAVMAEFRHTAHHQELKNCNCSLWFYIRLWLSVAAMAQPPIYVWVSQWSLSLRFPPPRPCIRLSSLHTRYMPHSSHFSRFNTLTILGEEYKSFRSSLCSKELTL